jgi:hypothetical protein
MSTSLFFFQTLGVEAKTLLASVGGVAAASRQVDQNLEGYQKIKMTTPTSDLKMATPTSDLNFATSSSIDLDNQLMANKRRRSADMVALGVTYNQALYEDDTLGGGNFSSG